MVKYLAILLILLSTSNFADNSINWQSVDTEPYEQIRYNYILECGHLTRPADCRREGVELCALSNFDFEKMEVHGGECAIPSDEVPEGYVHCTRNLRVHCRGRDELPRHSLKNGT